MSTTTSKLSLILMRDDGETRSIRISKKGLWLLIILTILSPITGLIGLWVGWEAWRSISNWQQEKLAYQIQVDELRVQLERFATLEALLKRQDAALGNKVSSKANSLDANNNVSVDVTAGAKKPHKSGDAPKNEKDKPKAKETNILSEEILSLEKVISQAPSLMPAKDNSLSETSLSEPSLPNVSSSIPGIGPLDLGVVKVENVHAKIIDDKRVQTQLGLFNTEKVQQISGHVQLALITSSGEKYHLAGSDTSFRISRFKSIVINSPLPVSKAIAEGCQLLVEVVAGDDVIYRHTYPLIDK